jgi:hypothetical protein
MMTMQDLVARQGFARADWTPPLTDAFAPQSVQAIAQESVLRTWELYRKSVGAAQGGARLLAEVAETAWGSARLLNDKAARNVASNTEAAFNAAEACAKAGSLAEIAALQAAFLRSMLAATSDQAKEFADLSTRATQHVIETMQGAAVRLMRTDF